jgi:TPR repeat protein
MLNNLHLWLCTRYHSASLQEYAPAQYNYALMHETGQHVEKNYGTALKWYRKAANHGDPDAQVKAYLI